VYALPARVVLLHRVLEGGVENGNLRVLLSWF
jgi:hypothetical protein